MAVVINFGADISVTKVEASKKQIVASSYEAYEMKMDDFLEDVETIKHSLKTIIKDYPEIMEDEVYVTLSLGCGLQYKTFDVTLDNFDDKRKMSSRERESRVFEVCQKFVPNCIEGNFEAAIVTAHQTDTDAVICCAYLPVNYLENIKVAFKEMEVVVLDIKPELYGFYKSLDTVTNGQLLVDAPHAVIIANQFGCVSWTKPQGNSFSKILIKSYLEKEVAGLYPINPETVVTEDVRLMHLNRYVLPGIFNETGEDVVEAYSACGIFADGLKKKKAGSAPVEVKVEDEEIAVIEERGKKDGLASKVRQLFKKK